MLQTSIKAKTKTVSGHKLRYYKPQNYIMNFNNQDFEIYASLWINKDCWRIKQDSQKSFNTLTDAVKYVERYF